MKNSSNNIRKIILDFEDEKISIRDAIVQIRELTDVSIEENDLRNYWKSDTLENFVKKLMSKPIINWEDIDDDKALKLISSILKNLDDDSLFEVNSDALEKKYKKAKGSLNDWIFHDDISSSEELLVKLKEDTILLL